MKATKIIGLFLSFLIVSLPVCFANSLSLTYDANGNLVTGDGLYREYNSLNQLWKVRNGSTSADPLIQEYVYHPIEERVLIKKTYNSTGNVTETVYYVNDNLVRIVNATGTFDTVYVKHEGQLVVEIKNDSSKLFYHPDHLGSTTLITDETGKGVENTSYTPYGVILEGGEESRYDYTGQEFDSVIGDYDYNARRYKAEWGKFLQADTQIPSIYNPQELNRYSYVSNNPYRYTDPTGHYAMYGELNFVAAAGGADVDKSIGIVITMSYLQGIQVAIYTSSSEGISTPTVGLNANYGLSPLVESPEEFSGESDTYSGGMESPVAKQVGTISIPKEGDKSKFSIGTSTSVKASNPLKLPVTGSKTVTRTELKSSFSISKATHAATSKAISAYKTVAKKTNTFVVSVVAKIFGGRSSNKKSSNTK